METRTVRVKVDGVRRLCDACEAEFFTQEWFLISEPQWRARRVVFNCFHTYKGEDWNELWLPGPVLTSRLICFLLRLRAHTAGASSDITWMFHLVQLLPEDKA